MVKDGFNFTPNQLYANVGDVIGMILKCTLDLCEERLTSISEYRFFPLNHSVARAGFGNNLPCLPYEDNGPGLQGFWSGFQPFDVVLSNVSSAPSLPYTYLTRSISASDISIADQ